MTSNGYPEFNYTLNENDTLHITAATRRSYLTDVLSAKAGSFIDSAAASGTPFMLEVATVRAASPVHPGTAI